jgi:RNA polymerase sigma-70 factor, ECF subfamily
VLITFIRFVSHVVVCEHCGNRQGCSAISFHPPNCPDGAQQYGETTLSTPVRGRDQLFPIVWSNDGAHSVSASEGEDPCHSDEELMLRLDARDSDALTSLYYRYSRIVLAIGYRVLHDRGEAEEIVQEAFFQLFQKANLFDPSKGNAKTWIVQIAYRRALDRKAYLDRRGFYLNEELNYLDDSLLGETDLDREIGAKLNRVELEKAFEELPEMQRRTLELFFFEGVALCDMIEKRNEPLGNIRHHFYRGLKRLRKSAFVLRLREK